MVKRVEFIFDERSLATMDELASLAKSLVPPKRDFDYAYRMGWDCGLVGSNETNCHFAIFSSKENTKAWEAGKAAAERTKAKRATLKNPYRRTDHRQAFEDALDLLLQGFERLQVSKRLNPSIQRGKRQAITAKAARLLAPAK